MSEKDDNQYKRLPVVLQTTAVKNFFEYTVDQLYSEANVETLNGFVGTPDWDGVRAQGAYIQEPTTTKQAYALAPTVNTISPESGQPESLIYYDEVVDILKTYGVDVRNQNKLFDAPYYTFSPPINEDKLLNFSEYYWAPPGANNAPNAIVISGTVESPVDVETDILGEQYYVHYGEQANVTFRNGMVVAFDGLYITPYDKFSGNTYVVEGVGYEIDLVPFERNSTAPYDSNTSPSYVVIERGAVNNNGWSRTNFWYHKNNWYDAGQTPPDRNYRAERPILEFNHRLETFNQGDTYLGVVDLAVTGYNYSQVNGLPANVEIDGVNPANKTLIFPTEQSSITQFVYKGVPYAEQTYASAKSTSAISANASLQVEIAGEPGNGYVDKIIVVDQGSGYTPANTTIDVTSNVAVETQVIANAVIYKGVEKGFLSIQIDNAGSGYKSNTISLAFTTDLSTNLEIPPVAQAFLGTSGEITQIDVITRGDNYNFDANISVKVLGSNTAPASVSVVKYDSYIDSVNITTPGKGYTQYQSIVLQTTANVAVGNSVIINHGITQEGNEYHYTASGWALSDTKRTANDPPLFVIYDDAGVRLDDKAKYPQSSFAGNKIFSYATPADISDEDAVSVSVTMQTDSVLGFPLVYRPFKAASEIVFTNNLEHNKYTYTPLGSDTSQNILGYNFYHLLPEKGEAAEQYYPYWKPSDRPFDQAIVSRYPLSQIEIDNNLRNFFIGCIPNVATHNASGVDVKVYLNGRSIKKFAVNTNEEGFITLANNIKLSAGDYLEIVAYSDQGLLSLQSASKYELPLGWGRNVYKENIKFTSEPEYLEHFKTQIQSQVGFVGEPLGQNNYPSTAKDTSKASEIVQSSSDIILSAYLLDDQPHNLVDALRFNSNEYGKYKARLKKTIDDYYATKKVDNNNIDTTLENVLREVISYRVGKNVFNRTYVIPFGDNFISQENIIAVNQTDVILDNYLDLELIEHSLLIFAREQGSLKTDMLVIDQDYTIINYNPITISLIGNYLGSTIISKLYTAERDSAQCPPTPSVLGMYPLFQPEIISDTTFETPQNVLIGHDGSRTPIYGDARDEILLDFEQRIYNASKKEFREANSLPELNFFNIRPGYFRNTGFKYTEWYNLMRYHFSTWVGVNNLDPITNEFYDSSDPWTWNYRGTNSDIPGNWRGLYEYFYDSVRPHTHPWEMLGFTEKPLWWNTTYGTDYNSLNSLLWDDLEKGIIRQGPRENLTQDLYKLSVNPYTRPNLFLYLPVDATGNLITPDKLPSGIVAEQTEYKSEIIDPDTLPVHSSSFISPVTAEVYPGITLSSDNANVYIKSEGLLNYQPPEGRFEPQPFDINLPRSITPGLSEMPTGNTISTGGLVGVASNGIGILNPKSGRSENGESIWHFNEVFAGEYTYENPGKYNDAGGYDYYLIPPTMLGNSTFLAGEHSPIIGWALDGIPIYGPHGYSKYNVNGSVANSDIVNIKSPFKLRADMVSGRPQPGPGGAPTGLFLEDYVVDHTLAGTTGYAGTTHSGGDDFAIRFGVTPQSPYTPIWFYVQCEDDAGNPMFPYALGGGAQEFPTSYSKFVYNNQFYATPNDFGGIFKVDVTDCGYGYVAQAVVKFLGDGKNAQGFANTKDGVIRNVIVDNSGKNYEWDTTTIEILGDGSGAQCVPVVIDGKIVGVRMTNYGQGYTYASVIIKQVPGKDGIFPGQFAELRIPSVAEDSQNGIVNDAVTEIIVTNKGYGYTYVNVAIDPALTPTPPVSTNMGAGAVGQAMLETQYDNSTGHGYVDIDADKILQSTEDIVYTVDKNLSSLSWRYSDGAPVENAWKYSENYPFAIAEGLLLGQPAQFATQYADPTKLFRSAIDSRQQLSTVTRERWQFTDPEQFRIHGERDSAGNFLTNIGYTQFINSWLAFQGLDTNVEFAPQLRTLNMRLSHRMSGYVDKDTMTVRTDQYSATGTTPSLIIPQDNINIQIHSSPYKSRNFYTGVIVEKATGGYKVRGFDRSIGTFPVLTIDKYSASRALTVGGEPAAYSPWQINTFYKKTTIVEYRGSYYEAPRNLTTGADFDSKLWNRLPSLPQINGASAQIWSKYLNQEDYIPYETLLETPQQVVDLLMRLGAWQKNAGYDFQGFDYNTGDSLNWEHACKQFLFWTTGKWEIGNTVELSPMAAGATFKAPRGFVAKLNRIERNQFTLLDADGSAIAPDSCEIIRLDDYIQVKPSEGAQIYGMLVFVKEIEHAMTLENRTDFNDKIYDPVLHQYQTRVKVKGKRTAGWTGKFASEGFIILEDELKPNLDNLAQSMGRYHELGFIPVEKQVYESARALFGYQSRAYLRDLDILDDQQFDFYKGMLQSKGTQTSMTRIGESNSIIIDGKITVYDEWAVKVGDFGDVESQQSIEFKLDRSNVTSDPQLVTMVFPEDVTGVIDRIDVINRNNSYDNPPSVVITAPTLISGLPAPDGRQATAKSHLRSDGKIDYIEVTDKGRGYEFACVSIVTQGAMSSISGADIEFSQAVAQGGLSHKAWSEQPINGNCFINIAGATLQFTEMDLSDDGLLATPSNVKLFTTDTTQTFTVGELITISNQAGNVCKTDGVTCANMANLNGTFTITASNVTPAGTTVEFTAGKKVGYPSTYGVSILYQTNNLYTFEFDNVYYHEANIEVSQETWGGKAVEDIINAQTANTGVSASMYSSHVQNSAQPGQTGTSVVDWYTLVLSSDTEFELIDVLNSNVWSEQFHIDSKLYTNQQRWVIDTTSRTTVEDISVIVNNQIIDQCKFYEINSQGTVTGNCDVYNWNYLAGGDYTGNANVALVNQSLVYSEGNTNNKVFLQTYNTSPWAPANFDDLTTGISQDRDYPMLDLYIGNVIIKPQILENMSVSNSNTSVWRNVWTVDTVNPGLISINTAYLPAELVDNTTTYLKANTTVRLVEKSSIKFTQDFTGDVYGSNIAIDVQTDDDLLCKISRERTYEITKDISNDDIIVLDVDDPTRFLKKPMGKMTSQLWPEYTDVNYLGVRDSKDYKTIPNSGYVNSANVNHQAYDIASLPLLFDESIKIKPTGGHTIHIANSENSDWNVYELKPTGADVQFVARQDDKVSLFTNYSLFNYIDGNMIGGDDTGRYLDYYLTLRNADVSDDVVVWTNETVIQQAQTTITDLTAPRMIEARISSISPSLNSVRRFTNYIPGGDNYYNNILMSASGLDQIQRRVIYPTISNVSIQSNESVETRTNPNAGDVKVAFDSESTGSGALFTATWDTTGTPGGKYLSTLSSISIVDGGRGYQSGDLLTLIPEELESGAGGIVIEITDVTNIEDGYELSNVITIGGIQNSSIQEGDTIRIVTGGNYVRAVIDSGNIDIDNDNRSITFGNVTNASEFIAQNTLHLSNATGQSELNKYTYTILDNSANSVTVTSVSIASEDTMSQITPGDFGSSTEIRSLNYYDLGDTPNSTDDTRNYFNVFNVKTNNTGITTLQIERPNTYFNYSNITSDVYNVNVSSSIEVTATTTGNIFTQGKDSIQIQGYTGALGAMNGVWNIISVVQNPANSNEDLVLFNTIKTLPEGDYAPPTSVYKTDTYMNISFVHMNKTRLIMPGVGDINVGDQIKVLGNVFSGTYNADAVVIDYNQALNDNSFTTYVDIPAPYIFDNDRSGNVLLGGLKITTTNPHGISPEYASQNKRIGVHFAYPKAYNRFYTITSVDPYNIYVDEVMTQSDETIHFYKYETTSVSKNDNVYITTNEPLLTRTTVTYASNSSVIAPNNYTVKDGAITFSKSVLPKSNTSVGVNIIREINRSYDRFPVLTTVDHNKIRLNGVNFTINSYNNPEAIAENINRAATLMRGWLTPSGHGMQFSFPMVKDYRTPVFAPDMSLRPAHTINNYGPYIRDKNTLARIANDPDIETGVMSLSTQDELKKDDDFNLGAIKIGPTKGATYYDVEQKIWMVWLEQGPTDTQGGYFPLDAFYNQQNNTVLPKKKKTVPTIPTSHTQGGAILDNIAGSYPVQRNNTNVPGQTQYAYDLMSIREYGFPALWMDNNGNEIIPRTLLNIQDSNRQTGTVKMYRYRLKPSTLGFYEVYEIVELTNGELIGIKVDTAIPPSIPHDYFATQSHAGNFYGLASNSINFDSKVSFNSSKVNLYPGYGKGSINLGPVSPPADIGRSLIPEPFAFRRSGKTLGNGSDSILNWNSLPDTNAIVAQGGISFEVNKPGFDVFNIWQPGMIPGESRPPQNASSTIDLPFGKGSGYYELNDGNIPEMFQVISVAEDLIDATDYANIIMGWADPRHCPGNNPMVTCDVDPSDKIKNDYPMVDHTQGWYNPQPRFKYSKRFTIQTNTSNNDAYNNANDWANSSVYYNSQEVRYAFKSDNGVDPVFVNGNYPDTGDTRFRPDEIFVACFWTESYIYKNQIVGFGPDPQNAGNRRPIIMDYSGTISRCKYIRLTELPLDAVLVRPECDTGWGGEDLLSPQQQSNTNGGTANDAYTQVEDERAGTSDTQNSDTNTGSYGGVTEENPDASEGSSYDTNNTTNMTAGYRSENNIIVEPGAQNSATPPNTEAKSGSGIGIPDTSQVGFSQDFNPSSVESFNNSESEVDTALQQNTNLIYPTVSTETGSASPVLNPALITLPGPCDITSVPGGNNQSGGSDCSKSISNLMAFTAANNYYGINPDAPWNKDYSNDVSIPKYEWHNFGRVANFYGNSAWVELVVDFRDDTLTAAGVTVVQSKYPFGKLGDNRSFNPRDEDQSSAVNEWWRTASIVPKLSSIRGKIQDAQIFKYGKDNFTGGNFKGRATGKTVPGVDVKIGLTGPEGANFSPITKPTVELDNLPDRSAWLTTDFIIGGKDRRNLGRLGNYNSLKGAFGFNSQVNCQNGEYLTVFVHIGHGSGNNGTIIPRYDLFIRYNHNIEGFGGSNPDSNDVCGDGSAPNSAAYTGGAHAKAYIAKDDNEFASIRAEGKSVLLGTDGKDETNLLADDNNQPYLFDNIYFPYNAPARQGTISDEAPTTTSSNTIVSNNSSGNSGNTFNFGSGLPGGGGSIGDFLDFNIR